MSDVLEFDAVVEQPEPIESDDPDPLTAARGIIIAVLLSLPVWVGIAWLLW